MIKVVQPKTEVEVDLADRLEILLDAYGCTFDVEYSPDGETPMPYGVWARGGASGDDLLGAGEVMSEALAEAIAGVRRWKGGVP